MAFLFLVDFYFKIYTTHTYLLHKWIFRKIKIKINLSFSLSLSLSLSLSTLF